MPTQNGYKARIRLRVTGGVRGKKCDPGMLAEHQQLIPCGGLNAAVMVFEPDDIVLA